MLQVHVLKRDFKVAVFLVALCTVPLVDVTVINHVITIMTVVLTFLKLDVLVSYDKLTIT